MTVFLKESTLAPTKLAIVLSFAPIAKATTPARMSNTTIGMSSAANNKGVESPISIWFL